ncbi:MAG: sulfatase [Rhodothermales bacterium]
MRPPTVRTAAVVSLMLFLFAGCDTQPATEAPPNLLFIITDDQRFDMMGNMNPALHTPSMDWLAENGVRFENAFVTTPICAASRASLLTGVVERTHRFTFITPALAEEFTEASYPAVLRKAGYRTSHIGKFGVKVTEGAIDTMFTVFKELNRNPYFKPQEDGTERHLTDITADHAIDFLEESAGSSSPGEAQPFALTLSFNAPHAEDSDERQYIWPAAMDTFYQSLDIPDPPLAAPAFHEALPEFLRNPEINMNRYRWFWRFDTPEKAKEMTKGYYRMISGVDAALERVFDRLDALGLAENTVIVLMGDNGYYLGERGYAGKWLSHEPSIRVPLLVYDPRHPEYAGKRPTAMSLNIDVAPTLLDLAGLEVPASMQGESLMPVIQNGPDATWRNDFFIEHLMDHKQIVKHEGVRGVQYKYARYFELEPVYEELYDFVNDPFEQENLAGNAAFSEVLDQMRERTDALRDTYGGPYQPHTEAPAMLP